MNSKGIEFQGLNLLSSVQLKELKRDKPVIKPVQKGSKSRLETDVGKGRASLNQRPVTGIHVAGEEDAKRAAEIMAEFLKERPEIESGWKFDEEHGILVVEIKNRVTGQVIRQIPPEEILSGAFVPATDASGNIINKTA
jgi:uncharacterized FlaG/YvyC family protein